MGALFCAYCGGAMGVYEPLMLIGHGRDPLRTSRLSHKESRSTGVLVHEDCFEKRRPWAEEASG